jgi:hypothetical protein
VQTHNIKENPADKEAHKNFMEAISYGKNLDWSTDAQAQ